MDRAPEPEDHQAALSMGNSVHAWGKFYDRFAFERDTQEGVNLMQNWRSQMLTSSHANVALPLCLQVDSESSSEEALDANENVFVDIDED